MILGTRETVSPQEEKLLKILGPLNNFATNIKQHKDNRYALTVKELCLIAKLDTTALSLKIQEKLEVKVSSICRAGSRFTKGCICVQFHEDGNDVIRWAMNHGAILCITREQIDDLPCIVVENPVEVYADMCKYFKDLSPIEVTAVVGSIGKTTTKRMISSVYSAQYNTFADPENENQIDCVGYICQHIPKKTTKLVQEVSEDTPGCLRLISKMLSPEIAVVTAIDKSHIEAFGDESKILKEIASVVYGMPEDGVVIINIDDDNTKALIDDRKTITVSLKNSEADYYAEEIAITKNGLTFKIVEKSSKKQFPVILNSVFAEHNVYSALYAFAAGVCAGVDYDNILKGLAAYRPVGIRQNIYSINKTLLYVDCYNAVARSVHSAVMAASKIPIDNKRIAVLGDVEEAGTFSKQIHKEIVEKIYSSNFDVLLAYGPKMIEAVREFNGETTLKIECCETRQALNEQVKKYAVPGNLILFKSSRKSALEQTISAVWPLGYRLKMLKYYLPIIKWRLKVICS